MTPLQKSLLVAFTDGTVGVLTLILDDGHGLKQTADEATVVRELRKAGWWARTASWRWLEQAKDVAGVPLWCDEQGGIFTTHARNRAPVWVGVPSTRRFRAAWKMDGPNVAEDLPKAKEIQKARVRREYEAAVEPLVRAAEMARFVGDNVQAAELEKQAREFVKPETLDSEIDTAGTLDAVAATKLRKMKP